MYFYFTTRSDSTISRSRPRKKDDKLQLSCNSRNFRAVRSTCILAVDVLSTRNKPSQGARICTERLADLFTSRHILPRKLAPGTPTHPQFLGIVCRIHAIRNRHPHLPGGRLFAPLRPQHFRKQTVQSRATLCSPIPNFCTCSISSSSPFAANPPSLLGFQAVNYIQRGTESVQSQAQTSQGQSRWFVIGPGSAKGVFHMHYNYNELITRPRKVSLSWFQARTNTPFSSSHNMKSHWIKPPSIQRHLHPSRGTPALFSSLQQAGHYGLTPSHHTAPNSMNRRVSSTRISILLLLPNGRNGWLPGILSLPSVPVYSAYGAQPLVVHVLPTRIRLT